jgi:hypothetical protein
MNWGGFPSPPMARAERLRFLVVMAVITAGPLPVLLLSSGCAIARKPKPSPLKYKSAWTCTYEAIDAKTGKPSVMTCVAGDGTRYKVRAE